VVDTLPTGVPLQPLSVSALSFRERHQPRAGIAVAGVVGHVDARRGRERRFERGGVRCQPAAVVRPLFAGLAPLVFWRRISALAVGRAAALSLRGTAGQRLIIRERDECETRQHRNPSDLICGPIGLDELCH
jgi:hypothetical protein